MKKIVSIVLIAVMAITVSCDGSKTETSTSAGSVKHVNAQEFKKAIDAKIGVVVDVRTPGEFAAGHVPNAKNIDFMKADFKGKFTKTLDKKTAVLIYCKSGGRSGRAAKQLKALGYTVYNMQGGFMGWTAQGLPKEY